MYSELADTLAELEYYGDTAEFTYTANGGSFIVDPSKGGRKCNGGDRGNSKDRARRKRKVLRVFGNGQRCRCTYCRRWLNFHTLTIDRVIPGIDGGTYRFSNIQPACRDCNIRRGDTPADQFRPPRVWSRH